MLYPNQRGIKINREPIQKDSKESFLAVKSINLFYAMKDLSNSAFKVYLYFLANKNGYVMGISPAAIRNKTGVCLETSRKAIRELETKGYIVFSDNLRYSFYEVPHKDVSRFGLEERKEEYLSVIEQSKYKDIASRIAFNFEEDDYSDWFN